MRNWRDWINPPIIVAVIIGIPAYWGMFHPNPALQQTITVADDPGKPNQKSEPPVIPHPFLLGLTYGAPIVSSLVILAAVLAAKRKSDLGLVISSARWYCTVFPKRASDDVTQRVQAMAIGKDNLELAAHQDDGWGDVCARHGGEGHHKVLEVVFSYNGKAVINYDRTQLIGIVRRDVDRLERRSEKAEPNWHNKANYFRTELERVSADRDNKMRDASEWKLAASEAAEDLRHAVEENKRLTEFASSEYHRGLSAATEFLKEDTDDLKDIDTRIFHRIRGKYINLPWHQKMALKRVWSRHSMPIAELILGLENSNFINVKNSMVRPLLEDTVFVETNRPHLDIDNQLSAADAELNIKSTEITRILTRLFKEQPLC